MIGKKAVPILELGKPGSDEHEVMGESLDIVERLDLDPAFGPPFLVRHAAPRKDLDDWLMGPARMVMKRLTQPRYATTPLAEFQTKSARETYVRNHPLPEPESYPQNMADSPVLIEELERYLWALEPLIHSPGGVTEGPDGKEAVSMDDILFFPRARAITLVRGLGIPPKLRAYLDTMSEACDIPLYDKLAS
ncbi:unnamed protein product [Discosporangium mesarthrocarpum]